jgi:hypothetical protein
MVTDLRAEPGLLRATQPQPTTVAA